jgi:2,4-dienoyl-CoA reductase-like NADH-dependent reductase (Old Yellow Enzyme family)
MVSKFHAAHGYLLSQLLSSTRMDDYGGTAKERRKILLEVIAAVRKATSDNFGVGVKLNAKDRQSDGLDRELTRLGQFDCIASHVRNTAVDEGIPTEEGIYCSWFVERLRDQLEEQRRTDSTSSQSTAHCSNWWISKGKGNGIGDSKTNC